MVKHDICVQGVGLNGVTQAKPVLLQMNDDDFPNAFLRDLEAMGTASLSSTTSLAAPPSSTLTLYQPVTRVLHLGLVQLACESPGYPRLDPKRVLSAGLVIRQAPLAGGAPATAWPWMKNSNGQSAWVQRDPSQADDDPDPTKRPLLQSGQPALDQMLAALTLASAMTESTTPAFVAAPDVCNAAKRTLVYALIPTASNEASTQRPPSVAQLDTSTLKAILPTPLKAGKHSAPYADECVNYQFMSDQYATSNNASDFLTFSTTLRMLYSTFGAFNPTPGAEALLNALNGYSVTIQTSSGYEQKPMGKFYQEADYTGTIVGWYLGAPLNWTDDDNWPPSYWDDAYHFSDHLSAQDCGPWAPHTASPSGGTTTVFHAPQTFYAGSATSGTGVALSPSDTQLDSGGKSVERHFHSQPSD